MTKNSILDELEYDPASGALCYKDVRYLLIRPETIVGFQKAIEKQSQTAAMDALFQGGYQGGYLSAKKYKDQGGYLSAKKYKEIQNLSDKETINFMMAMGAEIGWGNFRLDQYNCDKKKLQISVENSPFAAAYSDSTEGVCHLTRGVLCGLATILFSKSCTASEVECAAKGDHHCVFLIRAK
jgi:predicted hydrocarbon binding protein